MTSPKVDAIWTASPGPLTSRDRCDRCRAQAYVEVRLANGALLFCAHHYRQFEDTLRPMATSVHDERDRLRTVS